MTPSVQPSMLPPLSPDEVAHSRAVRERIAAELAAAGGWLPFDRYMELALYAPGLGYYSAGSAKLGAGGDFVTAPEMSDLYSRCLARQCADVLGESGGEILELGAGTGRMAAVLLAELAALGALPARYAILEVSADLAARQRARIASLPDALRSRVVWLERLPAVPFTGVVIANEVADALPCSRFERTADGVAEVGVGLAGLDDAGAPLFAPRTRPAGAPLAGAVANLERALGTALPDGYVSEVCLRLAPWLRTLGAILARGLLLLVDYGAPRRHFYHAQRSGGTLRCHFRQRAHDDPYLNVGVQDITAWVDFTAVAEAAHACGLEVSGFATQAALLLALGIESMVADAADDVQRARLAGEARRLLMPEEMGEAFKAMALTRGLAGPLAGFALQDLRHLL